MKINNLIEIEEKLPTNYIKRNLHQDLVLSLNNEEATILYGARQVGKSVEIWELIKMIFEKKMGDIYYFNFDIPPKEANSPDEFINMILGSRTNDKVFVFIDEAQGLSNIGKWIKYLYDQKKGIKWILSGSASLDLKNKVKESLIGRKYEYYLSSLSLTEISQYKGFEISKLVGNFDGLQKMVEEYLRFGGYPGVINLDTIEEKKKKLDEIAQTYLISDISRMYGIEDKENLRGVASYLAENVGNVYSKEKLSGITGISRYEVNKCVEAMEGGFIVRKIRTFSKDSSREVTHRPKFYFEDVGIRNALVGKLDEGRLIMDKGALFENLVVKLAAEKWGWKYVKYWRTNNQTEVDVVIQKPDGRLSVFEAKYSPTIGTPKNVKGFMEKYGKIIDEVKIVSMDNWWDVVK